MERCPDCGASLALVGRQHRCVPKAKPVSQTDVAKAAVRAPVRPRVRPAHSPVRPVGVDARRYRDPDKRREYKKACMREFMRNWRKRQKANAFDSQKA
jgi:hypothetical protein